MKIIINALSSSVSEAWESRKRSVIANNFNVETIWDNLTFLLKSVEISLDKVGESELSGDEDLLSTWELEFGSSEGFLGFWNVFLSASDGHEYLSDGDSS